MITLTAGEYYAERLATEAEAPVALNTMWMGTTLHPALAYESELRRLFDRYPDSMRALATKKAIYPPVAHFWQMPWELRLLHMEQECLNDIHYAVEDLDSDMVYEELWRQGYVRVVLANILTTLADDLTREVPWYKRWFIIRNNLDRELEKRITFLT